MRWALLGRIAGFGALWVAAIQPARAHEGPPFPIVMDRPTGPYVVSVWTDPDIGTGTFFVILAPAPGQTLPDDLTVHVCVQPTSKRLPEVCYPARRENMRDRVQYFAEVEFDQQEMWGVRVRIEAGGTAEEVLSEVEATPPGYGRWDLLVYSCPFMLFGMFWLLVALRGRRWRAEESGSMPPASRKSDTHREHPDGRSPPSGGSDDQTQFAPPSTGFQAPRSAIT